MKLDITNKKLVFLPSTYYAIHMIYHARTHYIEYDEWFDKNIDPMDLEYDKEKKFSNTVHEKFYKMSKHNLIIGGSEVIEDLTKPYRCSDGFCPISDEELKQL